MRQHNQDGAASLITVIFISLILTVITLGFIRLAVREQRSSSDNDLTTRAYYAAEAGTEDAKRALEANLTGPALNGEDCAPPAGYTSVLSAANEFDTEYTCQLIDTTPREYRVDLEPNQTAQTIIAPVNSGGSPANFDTLRIRWHDVDVNVDGTASVPGPSSTLPQQSAWGNWPAMLKVQIFSHQRNNVTDSTAFTNNIVFIRPSSAGANISIPADNAKVSVASCSTVTTGYMCEVEISGADVRGNSDDVYVRLTPLYRGARVSIQAISPSSNVLEIGGAQAVIDVTGRAGDVYRRVETVVDINQHKPFPDAAISSGSDICKDFFVWSDRDSNANANTSCTN